MFFLCKPSIYTVQEKNIFPPNITIRYLGLFFVKSFVQSEETKKKWVQFFPQKKNVFVHFHCFFCSIGRSSFLHCAKSPPPPHHHPIDFCRKSNILTYFTVGSAGQWEFEEDIFDRTDCVVHTFDCFDEYIPPKRIQSRVFSHFLCITGKRRENNNPRFLRYDELLRRANVSTRVTFLKMDIEGSEWISLPDILDMGKRTPQLLPKQIMLELHRYSPFVSSFPQHVFTPDDLRIFGDILFAGGYLILHRRDNLWCGAHCTELLLAYVGDSQRIAPTIPSSWYWWKLPYNHSTPEWLLPKGVKNPYTGKY